MSGIGTVVRCTENPSACGAVRALPRLCIFFYMVLPLLSHLGQGTDSDVRGTNSGDKVIAPRGQTLGTNDGDKL